jgi:hypothetical protein
MAEDVALLEADDLAVVEMEVGAADGAARHLEDDIVRLGDVRDGGLDHADVLGAEPGEGLHLRAIRATLRGARDERCAENDRVRARTLYSGWMTVSTGPIESWKALAAACMVDVNVCVGWA